MNYLTKKNFGVPTNLLASMAVLFGYALYRGSMTWVTIAFTVIVFMFDFDDTVRNTTKTALKFGFLGYLVDLLYTILRSVLGWFSAAQSSFNNGIRTTYKVFDQIIDISRDLIGFFFILFFAFMLINAIKGKEAKVPNIEAK
ncbi:MAG: hypothetical protein K2O03_02800 [Lachnospiraceae bacterium]|nr:hypothetical protein [Lachnospiraceae bacterium]